MVELLRINPGRSLFTGLFQDNLALDRELFDRALGCLQLESQESGSITLYQSQRDKAVTLIGEFFKHMKQSRLDPDRRILADSHCPGDAICQNKADTVDLPRQTVGIFFNPCHRLRAEGAVDPERESGADTMTLQEDHHITHAPLLFPGAQDPPRADLSDPWHFQDAIGFFSEDTQGVDAEG